MSRRALAGLGAAAAVLGVVGVTIPAGASDGCAASPAACMASSGPGGGGGGGGGGDDDSSTTSSSTPDDASTTSSSTTPDDSSTTTPSTPSTSTPSSSAPGTSQPGTTTAGSGPATSTPPASGGAPLAPADFDTLLATQCADQTGQALLAEKLTEVRGSDGSGRLVQVVTSCDVTFVGDVVADLGRPTTNVEALIADPANNVTPNQAQLDVLNAELALYWRIAESVVDQSGAPTSTSP